VWAYGCGRRGCPRCGIQKCQTSAEHLFERIYDGENTRLQAMVLTVPLALRPRLASPDGARWWSEILRGFVSVLRTEFGFTWAYVRSHPRGDESKAFAPHANLLGAQSRQWGRLDLDVLRAAWARILGYTKEINLHAQYFNLADYAGVAAFKHWCSYVERAFPGWSWAGQWARWYGQYPRLAAVQSEDPDKGKCIVCGEYHSYEAPDGADQIAIGALEVFLDSGEPVPPSAALRWQRLDPRPPPPVYVPPARYEQSALFSAGNHY
jgi:hypothetical protein